MGVSITINALFAAFKFAVGITALSSAMVSDAAHCASDVFIIVLIGIKISSKSEDKEHLYGHERFEAIVPPPVCGSPACYGNSHRQK